MNRLIRRVGLENRLLVKTWKVSLLCVFFVFGGGNVLPYKVMAKDTDDTLVKTKEGFKYSLKENYAKHLFDPPISYDGIAYNFYTTLRPLELINPLASRDYGYGRGMVSWNATQGKPKGFILWGIGFW